MDMAKPITKSRLLTGLHCPKQLWLRTYHPEYAKPSSTADLARAAGIELGKIARRNYPDGVLVGHVEQPDLAVAETARLVSADKPAPLFEAAFVRSGCLVRTDILVPAADGWRMIEVKSSGSVKEKHLVDCAIQLWVLEGAGIRVSEVCAAHVDSGFEYAGDGDYSGLILEENVTEKVRDLMVNVPDWLVSHRGILSGPEPEVRMGGKCDGCAFTEHCERDLPEYPVSILPHGGKIARELHDAGITDVRDIPAGRLQNKRHIMVWQSTLTKTPYISPILRDELDKLPYPRFYLDFETINLAIPRWAGTQPHQHIPVQWSCHIERKGGALEHKEFLEISGNSPMRAFSESLIKALDDDGPIIVYGDFEATVLKQLILFCPDFELHLRNIIGRLVDLLPWLREYYYHPSMKGSWSIKAVLPTIAPHLDYSDLEDVQNGTMAQQAYLGIISPDTDQAERLQKICNLLKYCERDTLAMVEVVRFLMNNRGD